MKLPFVESDSLYKEEPFKKGLTVFEILLNHRLAIIMKSLHIQVSYTIIKKFVTFCEQFTVIL